MGGFDYASPEQVEEILDILADYGGQAKLLAGGPDLLLKIKERREQLKVVVDVKRALGKQEMISFSGPIYHFSPLLTHAALLDCLKHDIHGISCIPGLVALTQAAKSVGSPQIRNRGTVGGNIINASPASDLIPALIAVNAQASLISKQNKRVLPIDQLFVGPGKTVLEPDEMLSEIAIEVNSNRASSFLKLGTRAALSISIVNVAASVEVRDGVIIDARIGLGSVGPTPLRAYNAEDVLKGEKISTQLLRRAADEVKAAIRPISDIRATADYRKSMAGVLAERVLYDSLAKLGYNLEVGGRA